MKNSNQFKSKTICPKCKIYHHSVSNSSTVCLLCSLEQEFINKLKLISPPIRVLEFLKEPHKRILIIKIKNQTTTIYISSNGLYPLFQIRTLNSSSPVAFSSVSKIIEYIKSI